MPPMARRRWCVLLAIGTLGGLFSGVFGVGGGVVIVPLLVLWLGFGEREAAGTSLAAIAIVASAAAAVQGVYGNVHLAEGVLVGVPAVGGVVVGAWLQQHVPVRALSLAFSLLLAAVAMDLLIP
jgi:uncharacterized membrane protein YfcA